MKKTNAMADLKLKSVGQKIKVATIEQTMSGFQNYGVKTLLVVCLLVASTLHVSAQKSAVLEAFSKNNIDPSILDPHSLKQPEDFAYEMKQTVIAAGKEKVTVATYDPSRPMEEQWTVVSVEGKSPSKSEINSFRKNQKKSDDASKTDDASYKIEKQTSDQLVISYMVDPGTVSKEAAFLKDCRSYMTINLGTKKLEQVQALNEKPVKIAILKADKLDLIVKYAWNDQAKRYLTTTSTLGIQAKFLGQSADIKTITEYSSYTKK